MVRRPRLATKGRAKPVVDECAVSDHLAVVDGHYVVTLDPKGEKPAARDVPSIDDELAQLARNPGRYEVVLETEDAKKARLAAAAEEAAALAALAATKETIAACEIKLDDIAPVEGEGFLYILQFSTGAIKVGQTVDLRKRLADHRLDAHAFNVAITDYWVSPAHVEYLANEQRLITYCKSLGRRSKREYFHGTNLAAARAFANRLTYTSAVA